MKAKIKLPKAFRNFVKKLYSDKTSYTISEAYVDYHYPKRHGLKSLRKFLGIKGNESCCDLYLIVYANGKKEGLLLEATKTKKSRNPIDIKRRLDFVYSKIKEKDPNLPVNHALFSDVKMSGALKVKHIKEYKYKILIAVTGKNIHLNDTDIPIGVF